MFRWRVAFFLAMELSYWWVVLPLALASLLTGILQSLGTPWGLLRHCWVLAKLVLTVFAITALLGYMPTIGKLAGAAADSTTPTAHLRALARSPVVHAIGGLLVLAVATVLGVYKPRGLTRYGWRKQFEQRGVPEPERGSPPGPPRWVRASVILITILVLLLVIVSLHIGGGHGPGAHLR